MEQKRINQKMKYFLGHNVQSEPITERNWINNENINKK